MALTLQSISIAQRKALNQTRKPATELLLRCFFNEIANDVLRNQDLKYLAFSALNSADAVISDSPCKVYVIFAKKPSASTTDAWLKGSDHATVAAANGDFTAKMVGTGG